MKYPGMPSTSEYHAGHDASVEPYVRSTLGTYEVPQVLTTYHRVYLKRI